MSPKEKDVFYLKLQWISATDEVEKKALAEKIKQASRATEKVGWVSEIVDATTTQQCHFTRYLSGRSRGAVPLGNICFNGRGFRPETSGSSIEVLFCQVVSLRDPSASLHSD
jgi:hypothetical protein